MRPPYSEDGAARQPTFNADVAPILFEACAPCHRPGEETVPFPLLTYQDARSHADKIARATRTGRMPPWLPEPGSHAFVGARGLLPDQIETMRPGLTGWLP